MLFGKGYYVPGGTQEKFRLRQQTVCCNTFVHQDDGGGQGYNLRVCIRFPLDGVSISYMDFTDTDTGGKSHGLPADLSKYVDRPSANKPPKSTTGLRIAFKPGQVC